MPTLVKNNGDWASVQSMFVKRNGVWVPVQRGFVKQEGVWVETYAAVVVATISSNTQNVNIQSLFTLQDWTTDWKKKVVVIDAGVIVGSSNPTLPALATGTGRSGPLEIIVNGEVQGAGGLANGGAGGPAIFVQEVGVTIINNGAIRGGGGGGGRGGNGGQGGPGFFDTVNRQPASGFSYSRNNTGYFTSSGIGGTRGWYWSGTRISTSTSSSITRDGWTYYRNSTSSDSWTSGASGGSEFNNTGFGIYRTSTSRTNTTGGAGGAGGNGGRGRGFDGANSNGLGGVAGSAGGTNAGTGGTGGTGGAGGTWGSAGATGNTGATGGAGNAGAGAAGTAGSVGGAAGVAVTGVSRTIQNNGVINGAT